MAFGVLQGNITQLAVDAIVNAANTSLLGGGGVDGAIHRAAGPELVAACRLLEGCEPGEAKLTKGFRLPARYVIHTVGPVWDTGEDGEDDVLAACYRNCIALARRRRLGSLAFPAISTGVYGFPPERAARLAVATVRASMAASEPGAGASARPSAGASARPSARPTAGANAAMRRRLDVTFVAFDEATADLYADVLRL